MRKFRPVIMTIIGLVSLIWLLPTRAAGGLVTDCTTFNDNNVVDGADSLGELLVSGGLITFGCSNTIIVPVIVITANTTLDGANQNIILSGNGVNQVINITPGTTVSLNHLTITGGQDISGGGIYNAGTATIIASTITGNKAVDGGGLLNVGTLNIISSVISGNSASDAGGGIINFANLRITTSSISSNTTANQGGGGIINSSSGVATIVNSTISNNEAAGDGGGIDNAGTLSITNSTISSNSALLGPGGGVTNSGTLTVVSSTFASNSTTATGGNLNTTNTLSISNSILANSVSGGDCANPAGTITASGANLVEDNSCGFATITADPLIGPLASNGGQTRTHALLPGSPAIDTAVGCPPPSTDQRGESRPNDGTCDLGAFELVLTNSSETLSTSELAQSALCDSLAERSKQAMSVYPSGQGLALQSDGTHGSIYCRIIAIDSQFLTSSSEIGNPLVLNSGVRQAVDLFGLTRDGRPITAFVAPLTICMRGTGQILFLSAQNRQPEPLASLHSTGEYTCAEVPNAGTVVLVNSGSSNEAASDTQNPLTACRVTTLNAPLNLRSEADIHAAVLAKLPVGLTLTATSYTPGWYRVIYLNMQGWLSATYVSEDGQCAHNG